jgi:hypothetical protein
MTVLDDEGCMELVVAKGKQAAADWQAGPSTQSEQETGLSPHMQQVLVGLDTVMNKSQM